VVKGCETEEADGERAAESKDDCVCMYIVGSAARLDEASEILMANE
jgi:hypothetical protein